MAERVREQAKCVLFNVKIFNFDMWDYMTSSISGNKKTETESFAPWKCLRLNN